MKRLALCTLLVADPAAAQILGSDAAARRASQGPAVQVHVTGLEDGAGFPSNVKLGRSRPKVEQAYIDVGPGITVAHVRLQYLRGLGGFGPVGPD